MAAARKSELIARLAREFTVIAEVGNKSAEAEAGAWCSEMLSDLASGAALVIAEGRETGTVGLFDSAGAVHADLVERILQAVGPETVIFEAPRRAQQAWMLRHIGPNVNLGNIGADDVVALETLRRGLRFDTLDLLEGAPRRELERAGEHDQLVLGRLDRRARRLAAARAHVSIAALHSPSIASIGSGAAPPVTVRVASAAAGSSAWATRAGSTAIGRPRTSRAASSSAPASSASGPRPASAAPATARPTIRYALR